MTGYCSTTPLNVLAPLGFTLLSIWLIQNPATAADWPLWTVLLCGTFARPHYVSSKVSNIKYLSHPLIL